MVSTGAISAARILPVNPVMTCSNPLTAMHTPPKRKALREVCPITSRDP